MGSISRMTRTSRLTRMPRATPKPIDRLPASSVRLHTCMCGFVPSSNAAQKRHRKTCLEWRDRPDPRGLMLARGREAHVNPSVVARCTVCKKALTHHLPSCPCSFSETARRKAVERAGLNLIDFAAFLVALQKRYPGGWIG